jgi:hypothetical protein
MLRKALELHAAKKGAKLGWKELMLLPHDFDPRPSTTDLTRALMSKMSFEHGGAEYDAKYPDGIPTSIVITDDKGEAFDSGLVMYPGGHARNDRGPDKVDLKDILDHKWQSLGALASDNPKAILKQIGTLEKKSAKDVASLYDHETAKRPDHISHADQRLVCSARIHLGLSHLHGVIERGRVDRCHPESEAHQSCDQDGHRQPAADDRREDDAGEPSEHEGHADDRQRPSPMPSHASVRAQ